MAALRSRLTRLLAAAVPALIVVSIVAWEFGAWPTGFIPWWDDEVVYWNEVAGFAEAGLNTGYVSVSGQTPPASFARFGPHGPVFTVLYGTVAAIAGWTTYSAFLVNMLVVTLGIWCWLSARRETAWGEVLLLAGFWPLLLYLPTHMQEPLQVAFAAVLAAATWRLWSGDPPARVWLWAAPVLIVAALLRPTWGLLLPALGWPQARRSGWRGMLLLGIVTVAVTGVAQLLFTWLSTPYPLPPSVFLEEARASWPVALTMLGGWVRTNVRLWLSTTSGDIPEVILRYVILALVVTLPVVAWRRRQPADRSGVLVEAAVLAIGAPLVLIITFGSIEAWRDFRALMPYVLFALLISGAVAPRVRWIWFATLIFLPQIHATFVDQHEHRFRDARTRLEETRAAFEPVLAYDPDANPWDNTILVPARLLEHPLLAVPPGMSLSYVIDWSDEPMPPRPRYLWLDDRAREELDTPLRLEALAVTSSGTLYRNVDAPR